MKDLNWHEDCVVNVVCFRYFQLLCSNAEERARFQAAVSPSKDEMVALGMPQFTVEDFYDNFMDLVTRCGSGAGAAADLEAAFRDQGQSDYAVVFLRLLASKQLQKEADFYQHFLADGKTVAEFCATEVEPMYHESDHIHITALTAATGLRVRVMYLDRGEREAAVAHDFPEGSEPLAHLLYRPGHYDVLYPKGQV